MTYTLKLGEAISENLQHLKTLKFDPHVRPVCIKIEIRNLKIKIIFDQYKA